MLLNCVIFCFLEKNLFSKVSLNLIPFEAEISSLISTRQIKNNNKKKHLTEIKTLN